MNKYDQDDQVTEVLNFWFSPRMKPFWFEPNRQCDREIQDRFQSIYELARAGQLIKWRDNYQSALALIIVLDQFPRNMFRRTAQAFATDYEAVATAKYALEKNYQRSLIAEQQVFLYMPLMHSEKRTDQAKSVDLFAKLGNPDNLEFAVKHQEIIDRFGRFPHRNYTLGRKSTAAEAEFLKQPGSSF